jgi:hypothetical protein
MDLTESFEVKMLKTWKRGVSRALSALPCKPSPGILPLENKHCRVQLGVPFYFNRGRGNFNTREREIIYLHLVFHSRGILGYVVYDSCNMLVIKAKYGVPR